jgi:hypothetical protein
LIPSTSVISCSTFWIISESILIGSTHLYGITTEIIPILTSGDDSLGIAIIAYQPIMINRKITKNETLHCWTQKPKKLFLRRSDNKARDDIKTRSKNKNVN